jgi:hypothetical protein
MVYRPHFSEDIDLRGMPVRYFTERLGIFLKISEGTLNFVEISGESATGLFTPLYSTEA